MKEETEFSILLGEYSEYFGVPFPTIPNLPMTEGEAVVTMKQCIAEGKPWVDPDYDPDWVQ